MLYVPTEAHKEPPPMTANPEQFPKSSESNIPHGHEPVSPDAQRIQPGISAPDTVQAGFNNLPPRIDERVAFDQGTAAVRDSFESKEKKKWSMGKKLGAGVAALLAAGGIAYGVNAGATANGFIKQPAPRPTAEGPAVPGAGTPPVETAPATSGETDPAIQAPEIAAVEDQIFYGENGEKMTYEQKAESLTLSTKEFPSGRDGMVGFFQRAEQMVEEYPTEDQVRNNLGYPETQKLTLNDYLLTAGLTNKVYNETLFDQPGSMQGNSIHAVLNKLAIANVTQRYNRLNDGDASNDTTPFDATLTVGDSLLNFSYHDNTFDLEPTKYEMAYTRDISRTPSTTPSWVIPSNTVISLSKKQ